MRGRNEGWGEGDLRITTSTTSRREREGREEEEKKPFELGGC